MTDPIFREATRADVPAIVAMLADDPLGSARESLSDLAPYEKAFTDIEEAINVILLVAERDGEVAGTAQLAFVPGLSHRGMQRADIEAVRIRSDMRGTGLGTKLIRQCIELAHERNCGMIQLTSNATRTDARRFYERMGFTASHIGFKLRLD